MELPLLTHFLVILFLSLLFWVLVVLLSTRCVSSSTSTSLDATD